MPRKSASRKFFENAYRIIKAKQLGRGESARRSIGSILRRSIDKLIRELEASGGVATPQMYRQLAAEIVEALSKSFEAGIATSYDDLYQVYRKVLNSQAKATILGYRPDQGKLFPDELKNITEDAFDALYQKPDPEKVKAILDEDWPMVVQKSDTATKTYTVSWRRLVYSDSEELANALSNVINEGISKGQGPRETGRQLEKALLNNQKKLLAEYGSGPEAERQFKYLVNRANRIVRDGHAIYHERASEELDKAFADVEAGKEIVAVLDSRTRAHHASRDGRIYYRVPKPGQYSIATAPRLPDEFNCRCTYVPVIDTAYTIFGSSPERASIYGTVPYQTFPTWFNSLTGEERRDIELGVLGKSRIKRLRKLYPGGFTWEQVKGQGDFLLSNKELDDLLKRAG